jgi:3-oxoacyl-[acyl-carrier protein] reductase
MASPLTLIEGSNASWEPWTSRLVIVSGSGRGIGREITLRLASQGARVVVNDPDAEPAEEAVANIKAVGG